METVRAVLVTGASTGIGRAIVERLAHAGHFVYAGARQQKDLEELGRLNNVQPLRLDVTSAADIAAAVEVVAREGRGLYGLVNNAGIATLGSLVSSSDDEVELVMRVNAHGSYRVTKAFAPAIIAARGRIIVLGSISGILAEENVGAYSMSKHALEAFADSLAAEIGRRGVSVSIVEPSNANTSIAINAVARLGADPGLPDMSRYMSAATVATAVELALIEPQPKRRYLVVSSPEEAQMTLAKQIAQLVQLNEGHRYTLDRAALIGMLDRALECARPRAVDS